MKLFTKPHNYYLEYIVQSDGWNVVSLNKYRAVTRTFGSPYVMWNSENSLDTSVSVNETVVFKYNCWHL
jgi:hypothetical protein